MTVPILIVDKARGKIWEEQVDPTDYSMGELVPGMAQAVQAMKETLPPVVRRDPRARYEAMLNRILPDMLRAYELTGEMPRWPDSLEAVLHYLAERDHDPTLEQTGGVEQVIRQGKAFVRYLAEQGARQQSAQDSKKVTLDWSGH